MNKDKIIDKIEKKIDSVEKLHDKESLMCEEIKDLLAELRHEQDESFEDEEEFEDDEEEEIDEEEEN